VFLLLKAASVGVEAAAAPALSAALW